MKLARNSALVGAAIAAFSILASTSPAHALTFSFSLPNNIGSESGTVTGTLVLPDTISTATAAASSLTITNAPGALSIFNGLQLIGNSNYSVQVNSFTYNSTSVTGTDLLVTSNTQSFNGNYLAFRFRLGDSTFPRNLFAASSSNDSFNIASGGTLASPSVINNNPAQVTFVPVSTAVPFDIPGGATIPALGGLLALGAMRKAKKNLAAKTAIANSVTATIN
ncbi:hypothetical protein [Anabaena azotica]|uniref:Uncharacterized protein n=1 Tax=Anabaena azotica FACHB-119 TaxID=947527 RepID=A0ABR8D0Z5_9NOST|nr:hypothetical protein [Anabaena azotica]MBD2500404.1 hypothetical protein [Anabaena azotica FACHB-119]